MTRSYAVRTGFVPALVRFGAVPVAVTALLWATSLNPVTPVQVALALALALVPWSEFQTWRRQRDVKVPLLALVAGVYWLYFAVPLFWGNWLRPSIGPTQLLSGSSITAALVAATLGVLCLSIGKRLVPARLSQSTPGIDIDPGPRGLRYVRMALVFGTAFSLVPNVAYIGGEQLRQIVLDFQTAIPLVAYVIILRRVLRGEGTAADKLLIAGYLVAGFAVGVSSGWLGSWLLVLLATGIVWLGTGRRFPWPAVVLVVVYVLFFQAGKSAFRAEYWAGPGQASGPAAKIEAWIGASMQAWSDAIAGTGTTKPLDLFRATVMRASLLTQAANVLDLTPSAVPYQEGSTYGYVAAGLVPRFLWSDKPSANDANQFYQVAYGLTAPGGLNGVSIAVGSLTEGYINFGWPGIVVVMLLIGALLGAVQRVFLTATSGGFFFALGIMMLLQFLIIESQLALYLSGLLEKVFLCLIVFWPILKRGVALAARAPVARDRAPRRSLPGVVTPE